MKKIIAGICIVIIGVIVFISVKEQMNIVARYISDENYRYNPVELNGELYFPSNVNLGNEKNLKSIGFLGRKDEGIINDSFLLVGSVLVNENDKNYINFSIVDDLTMNYTKGNYIEENELISGNMNKYNNFVLCNDKNDIETRIPMEKDLLYMLQNELTSVEYKVDDLKTSDDRYYIYVESEEDKLHDRTFDNPIVFMGCILIKDNKFYYGNLDNEIKGELLNKVEKLI